MPVVCSGVISIGIPYAAHMGHGAVIALMVLMGMCHVSTLTNPSFVYPWTEPIAGIILIDMMYLNGLTQFENSDCIHCHVFKAVLSLRIIIRPICTINQTVQ